MQGLLVSCLSWPVVISTKRFLFKILKLECSRRPKLKLLTDSAWSFTPHAGMIIQKTKMRL